MRKAGQQNEKFSNCIKLSRKNFNSLCLEFAPCSENFAYATSLQSAQFPRYTQFALLIPSANPLIQILKLYIDFSHSSYNLYLCKCILTFGLRRKNRDFDNFKSRVDFSLPILYYSSMSKFKRYYQDKNIIFITIVTYNRQQILDVGCVVLTHLFSDDFIGASNDAPLYHEFVKNSRIRMN